MKLPLPRGHHTITPALVVPGVDKVVAFLKHVFGAEELERYEHGEVVGHVEVLVGDSVVMMGEPMPGWEARPAMLTVYVDDVDAVYAKAIAAGGVKSLDEPKDQFYGDRVARVEDPCGNKWTIATVVEEVSREEMRRRFAAMG